jgi:predicted ester cyclase
MADEQQHRALVERYVDASNRGAPDEMAALFAEDASNHQRPIGREGFRAVFHALHAIFPDWHYEIERIVADGESVSLLARLTATHLGTSEMPVFNGLLTGVPPTGKRIDVLHVHLYRVVDGLIVEHRAVREDLGMLQQLGLMPAMGRP